MKRFFLLIFSLSCTLPLLAPQGPKITLVLAPFADPKKPGRTINGTFERGIALQFAESISTFLAEHLPELEVVIVKPGESHSHLEAASFINRLQPTFVCALSFYQETASNPHIHLYRYGLEYDLPVQKNELALYPYEQAHRLFCVESKKMLSTMHNFLLSQEGSISHIPVMIPSKPLLGIAASACAIEIGLPHDYDWQALVEPLSKGIAHALAY